MHNARRWQTTPQHDNHKKSIVKMWIESNDLIASFSYNISIATQIWRLRAELPWSWLRGWRQSRRTEKHVINWTLLALYIYHNTNTRTYMLWATLFTELLEVFLGIVTLYYKTCIRNDVVPETQVRHYACWMLWAAVFAVLIEVFLEFLDYQKHNGVTALRSWRFRLLQDCKGDAACVYFAIMAPSRRYTTIESSYFHAKPTRTRRLMRSAQEDSGYVSRISQWTWTLRPSTIT